MRVRFGAIVIGDEILSGKRQDKHMPRVIETLCARGLELSWCEYIGDDPAHIVRTLERSFDSGDTVLSFGGIGATPDDHTRECAAKAAGAGLALHPDAEAEIRGFQPAADAAGASRGTGCARRCGAGACGNTRVTGRGEGARF